MRRSKDDHRHRRIAPALLRAEDAGGGEEGGELRPVVLPEDGEVVDEAGEPAPGVGLEVEGPTSDETQSDAEGRYELSELEAGAEEQLRILRASGEEPPLPQA